MATNVHNQSSFILAIEWAGHRNVLRPDWYLECCIGGVSFYNGEVEIIATSETGEYITDEVLDINYVRIPGLGNMYVVKDRRK